MTILDVRPNDDLVLDQAADPIPPAAGPPAAPDRSRWRRPTRAGWITAAIGAGTMGLYSWGLSSAGSNTYYTAAVKSGTISWKAFFYGAIDPGSFITVDKPPAALWLQELSGRLLGFSTFSMLLPEVLCGVASVLLLHNLVRRFAGQTAAHLASLALALTPVAVLMFRFNNPDALLTFLCIAGAWAVWNAVETGRTRWLVAAGAIIGLAFDTKMAQALVVLPALALVYLVAGPPKLCKRLWQLALMGVALVVGGGWWVAIVALTPAASRPFIGSTSDNSIISLIVGYNGLARILGRTGSGGGGGPTGGGGNAGFGSTPGWGRLFNAALAGQVAWFIPLAAAGLVAGLWLTRRAPRTSKQRAGWLLWGAWAVTVGVVFSKAAGTFHPYYTVQLAPAVAALAGAGAIALWNLGRTSHWLRFALPAAVVVTAAWGAALLARTPTYHPWLRNTVLAAGLLSALGLFLGSHLRQRLLVMVAGGLAVAALLGGPTAYALTTVTHTISGSIVSAGPSSGGQGGFGGSTSGSTDTALITYLEANQGSAEYLVAAFGSQSSASIILATGKPVITIGGFTGSDPAPTLAQLKALVAEGKVRYLLVGGGGGGGRGGSSEITTWATSAGRTVSYGGSSTLYDLQGAV